MTIPAGMTDLFPAFSLGGVALIGLMVRIEPPPAVRFGVCAALGLLLPVGLAVIWEIWVALGYSNGRLVPPPTKIFATVMELARSGELSRHITATVTRVAAGFGLGVVAGTILGAISGYWGLARQLLDPTVQALRAIPSIAWVPLFILWLGIFETSKIALIAVGVAIGDRIDSSHLAVAVPLCLARLVAPRVLDADTRCACLAAALASLCTAGLPAGTGVLVAGLAATPGRNYALALVVLAVAAIVGVVAAAKLPANRPVAARE